MIYAVEASWARLMRTLHGWDEEKRLLTILLGLASNLWRH